MERKESSNLILVHGGDEYPGAEIGKPDCQTWPCSRLVIIMVLASIPVTPMVRQ
jgi:hypothetical protein